MLRTLSRFALPILLLAVSISPVRAAEPVDAATIKSINDQLRDIRAKLDLINPEVTSLKLQLAESEIRDLKKRLEELESRVRAREEADKTRVARAFTPSTTLGVVELHNRTPRNATIVLEGVPYDLAPFQLVRLPARPIGNVSYEAFAEGWGRIRPLTTALLTAERPLTIFVYDR